MRLMLGTFGRRSIETHLEAELGVAVHAAMLHYALRLRSGSPPVAPPAFLPPLSLPGEGPAMELAVGPAIETALRREAHRHGIPVETVLRHALLVYLADRDREASAAGRQR